MIECSLIVPIYRNEEDLPDLLRALSGLAARIPGFEAVLVVDASPDNAEALLRAALPRLGFPAQLLALSRNFGAFAAIREGVVVRQRLFFHRHRSRPAGAAGVGGTVLPRVAS
jgi:glycosyltransferase involved in cell wall biosynthesis